MPRRYYFKWNIMELKWILLGIIYTQVVVGQLKDIVPLIFILVIVVIYKYVRLLSLFNFLTCLKCQIDSLHYLTPR